jgi:2-amino-4-hydroxy-6-hydroxymethyldihydropteridine diphosphokinase
MSRNLANPPHIPGPREGRPETVAVVAFGANLGDREDTIRNAAERIGRLPLVSDVRLSPLHETVALTLDGPDPDAPGYVNAVALVTTRLAPSILLGMLHAIEDENGRERHQRWGDRTLDLDLIAYGDETSTDPHVLLPHPRAFERLFVLEPWLELDPDAVLPGHGRVAGLVDELRRLGRG